MKKSSAVFDNIPGPEPFSYAMLPKSYRFKGLTHDVLIKDGITTQGSIEASGGIVLTSPNGTKYKVTVDNDGSLTTTAV